MSTAPGPPTAPRRGLRLASRKYEGKNGFTEKPTTLEQKIEAHEHALDILRFSSVQIPDLDTIMNTDWTKPEPETSASVQKEIDELRKHHASVLSKIYDLNSTAYLDDVEDRYRSRNEVLDEDPKEWMRREYTDNPDAMRKTFTQEELNDMIEASNAQKHLYESKPPYPFSLTAPTPAHLPNISRLNYSYLQRLIPLYRKLEQVRQREHQVLETERQRHEQEMYNLHRREEEARRVAQMEKDRLERKFPTTVEEFNTKPKDFQNLIVRFLNASEGPAQERQLVNNKWQLEDVKPLMRVYAKNDLFRTRVIGMFMSLGSNGASSDPRRRTS
ncbi:hypothetical protein GYMLUDRAFT_66773 [Collybiopsis luxurians FD-317 M1]|nr:hypothetical protein GYMLUDRAFT_66773 [Collybiopsis luxurians FD-317 M1]